MGKASRITEHVAQHLARVVADGDDRRVGGPGNLRATGYVAEEMTSAGYAVERIGFDCVDWVYGDSSLEAGGERIDIWAGPYSPPLALSGAPLVAVSDAEALAAMKTARDHVLLLHGDLVKDQLTPRNYPFYNVELHKRIYAELDRLQPLAVIAATGSNPGAVGAISPFPYIEDAEFEIPSAYIREADAGRLLAGAVGGVRLTLDSDRIPATAEQLVGTLGDGERRVVLSAHVDSRFGTPGALDNAGGVACLLGAAELLAANPPAGVRLEIVPFNGEDNFAAYGEMAYLASRGSRFDDIALAINIDAAGYVGDSTAISTYALDEGTEALVAGLLGRYETVRSGPQWPQSDHMIFAMRGVPTLAVTSTAITEIAAKYHHTERDVIELVDPELLADAARFIADAVRAVVGRTTEA